MSGAETISRSGVPVRLRSIRRVGLARGFVVQAFAGVFFEVRPDDADLLRLKAALGIVNLQPAVLRHRQVVLADLITLGQIGIVILLAVPLRELGNLAVQRQRRLAATAQTPAGSSPASCPACRCKPGTSAYSAARQTSCCSRRTASSPSEAGRGFRGRR